MIKAILSYLLLATFPAQAQWKIQKIENSTKFYLGEVSDLIPLGVIDMHLYSSTGGNFLGHAQCETRTDAPGMACELDSKHVQGIVREGDLARVIDFSQKVTDYKGSTTRLIKDRKDIRVEYMPLLHQGLITGETAATLNAQEFFLDMFGSLQYGITNRWEVGLDNAGLLSKILITKFKFKILDTNTHTLSMSTRPKYLIQEKTWNNQMSVYFDTISNGNTVNHLSVTIGLDKNGKFGKEQQEDKASSRNGLLTGTEHILENWDRIVYGPSYNFDNDSIGGFFSYVMIVQRFHFVFSLETTDITNLKISTSEGYLPSVYAYYRY